MQMFYVTSPAKVVNSIQSLLGERRSMTPKEREKKDKEEMKHAPIIEIIQPTTNVNETKNHTRDIRSRIDNIIR